MGKEQILPPPWALPCEEKTMRVGGYYWVKRDCDSDWEMGDSICHNQCPKHEGRMDWPTMEEGGITVFEQTGVFQDIPNGTVNLKFMEQG